ncbi:MAG: hypothetical protein AB2A00_43680, partial [Myxococcota bacterium]
MSPPGFGLVGALGALSALAAWSGWLCTFDQSMAWGVALVCSCVGWGRLLHRVLRIRPTVDVGLESVWGISVTLAVGGPLVALRLFTPAFGHLWVGAGLVG